MDQLLKMTEKDYPSHNARVDVPFKDGKHWSNHYDCDAIDNSQYIIFYIWVQK